MPSAYKRGVTWTAKWSLGRDASGAYRYQTQGGFRTRKLALRHAHKQEDDLRQAADPERRPLGLYLTAWLGTLRVRPRVLRVYRSMLTRYLKPIEDVALSKLTPDDIIRCYTLLRTRSRPLAERTLLHLHRLLGHAIRDHVTWWREVPAPRPGGGERRTLSMPEVRLVLGRVQDTVLELPFLLTVTTGLRAGELLGLQWHDLEGGRLSVQRSRQWESGRMLVLEPKTPRSRRTLTLPPVLGAWLEARRGEPDEWLVPLTYDGLSKRWRRLCDGLPFRVRWHDLRHTFASLALASGTPVHEVSAALGHERTSTTLDIYAHVMADLEGRAVAAVATNLLQSSADSS